MKQHCRLIFFVCGGSVCMAGCGSTKTAPPSSPVSNACTRATVSGTMLDSLTNQPVSQGWAVLEAGTQLLPGTDYNFSQTQKIASDAHGSFSLCSPAVVTPSAIVLVALDALGKAYPAFVAPVSGATALGSISMGSCNGLCDAADGQQQASSPAVIGGTITSAPVIKGGSVTPQYTVSALDGSKSGWNLAIPSLDPAQSNTFFTTPGMCVSNAPFCATYSFTVPAQKPLQRIASGYAQPAGAPTYSIYAAPDSPSSCKPPFSLTTLQQNGTSFLTATPGVQLSAADIRFTGC